MSKCTFVSNATTLCTWRGLKGFPIRIDDGNGVHCVVPTPSSLRRALRPREAARGNFGAMDACTSSWIVCCCSLPS